MRSSILRCLYLIALGFDRLGRTVDGASGPCSDDPTKLSPLISGSRSDSSLNLGQGGQLVLQCSASYEVKWVKLYQKDTLPVLYHFSQVSNDSNLAVTAEPGGNLTLSISVITPEPDVHTSAVYSCIAASDITLLENFNSAFSSAILDSLRITKVALNVVQKASSAKSVGPPAQSSDRLCFPDRRSLTAEALLQTLNGDLLASKSATLTLEKWCGDHKLAPNPKVVAIQPGAGGSSTPPPLPDIARDLLRLSAEKNETIRYRSVELSCGEKILSVADNWYVQERLTPEMNTELDTTTTPFGKVVLPLEPFRQTAAVKLLWRPLPDLWEMDQRCPQSADGAGTDMGRLNIPDRVLEHQAIVCSKDGTPISFVDERYTKSMFDFL